MPHRMLVGILIQDGEYDHQNHCRDKNTGDMQFQPGNVSGDPAREETIQLN